MKIITERHGEPCNHIELTEYEYRVLYSYFLTLGVELRPIMYDGKTQIYECQARNPYKDELRYKDKKSYEIVTKDIERGWWRR